MTRTTRKTVIFTKPFILAGLDEHLPAGAYDVEIDEEPMESLSFIAYRRALTLLHLPAKAAPRGLSRTLTVDPDELDAALKHDEAPSMSGPVEMPIKRSGRPAVASKAV